MRKISCEWIFGVVGRVVNNCEGRPKPSDQVASAGRRSIGNVNDSDDVQCGSKSDRTIHLISGIR